MALGLHYVLYVACSKASALRAELKELRAELRARVWELEQQSARRG
jgi:hypothetical protein